MILQIFLIIATAVAVAVAIVSWSKLGRLRADNQRLTASLDQAAGQLDDLRSRHEAELAAERALAAEKLSRAVAESTARTGAAEARVTELKSALTEAEGRIAESATKLAEAQAENARLSTQLQLFTSQAGERDNHLRATFENLANEILRRNSADFKAQNAERLAELLDPLRANIDEFKKTVLDTYSAETRERTSLLSTIKELRTLNDSVMQETRQLTNALRGNNRVQGNWGEMVLESILDQSGLQEGVEYTTQLNLGDDGHRLRNDEGTGLRPDVVVNYPGGGKLVIDAKTNLSHYFDEIDSEKTDDERRRAAEMHAVAVRTQVDSLAKRDYSKYIGGAKLDFVMMFIPNEPAYISAMRTDRKLWQYAYDRKVLIVSPTHLVSALRLIKNLWARENITTNALEIGRQAGAMYDKFAAFTTDLEKVQTSIDSARSAYDEAIKKLATGRDNLVRKAERLRDLGVATQKKIAASIADQATLPETEAP